MSADDDDEESLIPIMDTFVISLLSGFLLLNEIGPAEIIPRCVINGFLLLIIYTNYIYYIIDYRKNVLHFAKNWVNSDGFAPVIDNVGIIPS